MANEKFSEFTVKTDLTDFTGLVGFETNTANYYITTSNFYNDLEANLNLTDFTTGIGGAGDVLTVNGTGTGLEWSAPASGGVSSITFGTTGLTPSVASTGAITVAGTLSASNGGTGFTGPSNIGDLIAANTASSWTSIAAGTIDHVLTSLGPGILPIWKAVSGGGGTVYGYFQGIMVNPGDISYVQEQVIWSDPVAVTSQYGVMVIPFDCEIEKVTLKWIGDTAPTIAGGDGTTSWVIGKLTSNTGTTETTGGANFTDLTPTSTGVGSWEDLNISDANGDSGTFVYKKWDATTGTNAPVAFSENDIMVFRITRGTGDWSQATDDMTVNLKYKLT